MYIYIYICIYIYIYFALGTQTTCFAAAYVQDYCVYLLYLRYALVLSLLVVLLQTYADEVYGWRTGARVGG
jgi:hypothetical protein